LNFFRSLHTIHGQALEMKKYSFIVYENNNLQTLWNPRSKQQIELKHGNMLFTANSKLCLHEIQFLQSIVAYNDSCGKKCDFISHNTNGYMASCIMEPIFSESNVTTFENVTIRWKAYKSKGQQTIVGYTIFYIEAPQTNITSYYGQDSCSSYSWHSEFVAVEELKTYKGLFTHQITNLTQFTQYAYYVRTTIIQSDPMIAMNGQSEVRYFKTFADQPSAPIDVFTLSKSSDSITLGWSIKPEEKEIVDHFTIDVLIQPDISDWYNQGDFCQYPLFRDPVKNVEDSNSDECCCDADNSSDQELIFQLHSTGGTEVNCALDAWSPECESVEYRLKRSPHAPEPMNFIEKSLPDFKFDNFYDAIENLARNPPGRKAVLFPNRNRRDIEQYKNYVGTYIIRHAQNLTLTALVPFTTYIFQVFAWGQSNLSSPYFLYHEHTNALLEADNVHLELQNIDQNNVVELLMRIPAHPNGALLGFNIEYKRLDQINETSTVLCVPRKTFSENKFVHTFNNLTPGWYEVRACAHSLAGRGVYSEWQPFRFSVSTPPTPGHKVRDVSITLGVLTVVILAMSLGYFWHNKRHRSAQHDDKIVLVDEC
jgi:Receptor L domain